MDVPTAVKDGSPIPAPGIPGSHSTPAQACVDQSETISKYQKSTYPSACIMDWLAGADDLSQNVATISNAFEVWRHPNSKPQAKPGLGKTSQRRSKGGSASFKEAIDSDDGGLQEAHGGISGGYPPDEAESLLPSPDRIKDSPMLH